MLDTKQKYYLISFLSLIITIILVVAITLSLLKKFPKIKTNLSSCGKNNTTCNYVYNIKKTGQPKKVTYCKNMVKCITKSGKNDAYTTVDFNLSKSQSLINFENTSCFTINNTDFCCKGFLPVCASLQIFLQQMDYNIYNGNTVVFSDQLCKFLPSCFANNNSSPYLLFPVPDFGINLFDGSSTSSYNVDPVAAKSNTIANTGFGTLGNIMLSEQQAIVIAISLPPLNMLTYFSMTPYIFSSSRFGSNFANGILFNSLSDPLNLYDILNVLTSDQKSKWQTEPINILIISTHNKNLATSFVNDIKNYQNTTGPTSFISEIEKNFDISIDNIKDIPILCVPIPAGSTFGNTFDPLGRPMLKEARTNKYINKNSPIFDYTTDTFLLLGRIVSDDENTELFETWKNETSSQSNSVVVGFEKDIDYEPFTLSDQNGYFYKNNSNNLWGWTTYSQQQNIGSWIGSNFKLQTEATIEQFTKTDIDNYANTLKNQLKKELGFTQFVNVDTVQLPSPFHQYNDYITKYYGKNASLQEIQWSQLGIDLAQFNIPTYGDCRDTVYPRSDNFCLGMNDLVVLISQNYMLTNNSNILYNSLNLYDTQTLTSFGSLRGNNLNTIYSVGFSRSDLTCSQNFVNTSLDSIKFIATGPHSILAASQDTNFLTMNRVYLNVTEPVGTNNYIFATSPSPINLSQYTTIICRPCKNKKLKANYCNNLSSPSSPASYCVENNNNCNNNLITQTNKEIKKQDEETAVLCNQLRNPKSNAQTQILVISSISGSAAIFLFITIIFIIYIQTTRREELNFRCNIYYITVGFFILTCSILCIFSSVIWGNRIKNVPSTTYDIAVQQN